MNAYKLWTAILVGTTLCCLTSFRPHFTAKESINIVEYVCSENVVEVVAEQEQDFLEFEACDEALILLEDWKPLTTDEIWRLAGSYKTKLKLNYRFSATARNRIEQDFGRNVIGRAVEEAVLFCLNLTPNTQRVGANLSSGYSIPDALENSNYLSQATHGAKNDIYEVKIVLTANHKLEYSGRTKAQIDNYLYYLTETNTHRATSMNGYLILLTNAGITVDTALVNQATLSNIPVFHAVLDINSATKNIRVGNYVLLNKENLSTGEQLFDFLPKYSDVAEQVINSTWFKKRREQKETTINFKKFTEKFDEELK